MRSTIYGSTRTLPDEVVLFFRTILVLAGVHLCGGQRKKTGLLASSVGFSNSWSHCVASSQEWSKGLRVEGSQPPRPTVQGPRRYAS